MQFADYASFRSSVRFALDAANAGIPPARPDEALDMFIAMGEERVHHDLRASTMVTALAAAVTSNAATLPDGVLALREVYFSGEKPLDVLPLDRLRALEAGDDAGGDARFYAQAGNTIRFWPTATGTVLGSYYARPSPLKTVTWAQATTFARYPHLYLYAALAEAAPILGLDGTTWEGKFNKLLDDAQHDERVRALSGGPLRMRSR